MSLIKKIIVIPIISAFYVFSMVSCNQTIGIWKNNQGENTRKMEIKEEKFEWKYDETKIKEKPVFYSNVILSDNELQNNFFTNTFEMEGFIKLLVNEIKTNEKYSNINTEEHLRKITKSFQEKFPKSLFYDKFVVFITTPEFIVDKEKDYELVYHDNINIEFYRLIEKDYYQQPENAPTIYSSENEQEKKIDQLILSENISNEEKSKNKIMKFFIFDKKDVIFNNLKIYYDYKTYNEDDSINDKLHHFQENNINHIYWDKVEKLNKK
ncbi:hypothetical protein [Mycoplasma sp. 5370]